MIRGHNVRHHNLVAVRRVIRQHGVHQLRSDRLWLGRDIHADRADVYLLVVFTDITIFVYIPRNSDVLAAVRTGNNPSQMHNGILLS